ncbi:MAG TPA: hypothetical protein PLG90_04655 [Ignavibacteria bacterium]|nr:hypothetical protein [Ignavibacteria bacterium]
MKKIILSLILFVAISYLPVSADTNINSKTETEVTVTKDDCKYWITSSSGKRHNKKCRWYKSSKGYCSEEAVGTACKKCGG